MLIFLELSPLLRLIRPTPTPTQKDRAREVHNGSADSGKSSSPDATSSGSLSIGTGSMADSLEDRTHRQEIGGKHKGTEPASSGANPDNNDNGITVEVKDSRTIKNAPDSEPTLADTTTPNSEELVSGAGQDNQKLDSTETTLPLVNNNVNREISQQDSDATAPKPRIITTATKQQQASKPGANNNNYSGLNLNMTASEMRELLARRKKFDPKKAQMNIRQKYEIIQQM